MLDEILEGLERAVLGDDRDARIGDDIGQRRDLVDGERPDNEEGKVGGILEALGVKRAHVIDIQNIEIL